VVVTSHQRWSPTSENNRQCHDLVHDAFIHTIVIFSSLLWLNCNFELKRSWCPRASVCFCCLLCISASAFVFIHFSIEFKQALVLYSIVRLCNGTRPDWALSHWNHVLTGLACVFVHCYCNMVEWSWWD